MAAQGNITLNSKVYHPRGKSGDISKWVLTGDTDYGSAASSLTESVRDPSTKDANNRIRFHLDLPLAATADSTCSCTGTILGTASCDIYVVIPQGFTQAQRDDLLARIQDLVADAVFESAVSNLEGSW